MRLKVKKKPRFKLKPKQVAPVRVKPFSHNLSCDYRGNFPFKPKIQFSEVIASNVRLESVCEEMMTQPAIAFDTETNTLAVLSDSSEFKCVGISISWGEYDNYYIPLGHIREEDIESNLMPNEVAELLQPVFRRKDLIIFGWNLKFDMHVMKRLGIDILSENLFDGMLASWLCDENVAHGLKETSVMRLGLKQTHFNEATDTVPKDVKKQFGYKANSRVPFDLVLIEDGAPYAIDDAFNTWCNCIGFMKELEKEKMDNIYYKMYAPFMRVLFEMEEQGVTVDLDRLKSMGEDMQNDLEELQYKIYELAGVEFNIGSTQQKAEILFGYEKEPTEFKVEKLAKYLQKAFEEGDVDLLEEKGYTIKRNRLYKLPNSNKEILDHSFYFKPTAFTKSGAPSSDSDAIWKISQKEYKRNKRKKQGTEMCKYMLEYAKLSKLKTAFVDGILDKLYEDGKAHPNFNQIGTDSGRLSCSNPNLQQLPKANEDDKYQIRSVFIGSVDPVTKKRMKIIAIDYHNLEMVCLTHFSGDKNLSEMFANDDDAHGSTAVNMFNLDCTPVECKKKYPHLRQAAKTINFLLMYGGGAKLLYENLKSDHYSPLDLGDSKYLKEYKCRDGVAVAQKFIDKYFESYSGVAKFIQSQKKFAHKHGYVYTILGRLRRLPDINSRHGDLSSYSERLAVNSAIQGTAGDITINSQLRISKEDRLKELRCNMLIQVHDELVFECPEENLEEAIQIIKWDMEHPFGDDPNKCVKYLRADYDTGDSYQDAK